MVKGLAQFPNFRRSTAARAAVERLKFGNWAKPFTIAGRLGFSLLSQLRDAP